MAVVFSYGAGVTDLKAYQVNVWKANYDFYDHGFFAGPGATKAHKQWAAGNLTDSTKSGVLLNGDFSYVELGGFTGSITSLSFGTNLSGNSSGYTINPAITFDLSSASATNYFKYAIYEMSNFGTWSNFYSYLGEQGTVQTGNAGVSDTLYGFSGVDTFIFQSNSGNDTIKNFDSTKDIIDISAWGVTDMSELTFFGDSGWSVLIMYDGRLLEVQDTSTLTADNFIFAPAASSELLLAA